MNKEQIREKVMGILWAVIETAGGVPSKASEVDEIMALIEEENTCCDNGNFNDDHECLKLNPLDEVEHKHKYKLGGLNPSHGSSVETLSLYCVCGALQYSYFNNGFWTVKNFEHKIK